MKDQHDSEEMDRHFDDSYEGWFRLAPRACRKCGAVVAWDYIMQHIDWHASMEKPK